MEKNVYRFHCCPVKIFNWGSHLTDCPGMATFEFRHKKVGHE